ncbi:MAG: sulfurtransferase complex subunit TusB [Halioglobus sp.]
MILHTLNTGTDTAAFRDCLNLATANDAILLMGDGVYTALDGTTASASLQATGAEIFILASDARAAGILSRVPTFACLVDFEGFVSLTVRFDRQLAWY